MTQFLLALTPEGSLSEHDSALSPDETNEIDSENLEMVKDKNAKKDKRKKNYKKQP